MDFKLTRTDRFPVGTSVAAYPASARREGAAPFGSAVDTQTMAADGLTFTGLQPQTAYVAYAKVGDEHRYISFLTPAEPPPQGGGDFNPDALTAAGVPVLLGQGILPDGVNMSVDATQSMQFLNIEGLEVGVAGPVIMEYQNAFQLTEAGEADHHFTIQPDGGPVQPTEIVWVQRAETLNQFVPITWRIAVDLQPGTYKFGWRCVVLSGKLTTSGAPGLSQMTVYTCPPTVENVYDYTWLGA